MKRRNLIIFVIVIIAMVLGECISGGSFFKKENRDAIKFKEEYELINGTTNSSGKEHRSVSIDDDNSFVYTTASKIVEKMENGETFYVYFGSKLCPWCRSVIEEAIKVANENNIKQIYYVDIWDDDGNEILRDNYTLENGKAVLDSGGTDEYYKLLDLFDNVLGNYSLTDEDGNSVNVGEKRIYAPNFIYVEDGEAIKLTLGISDKQTDSRAELTDDILKDEEKLFNEFFDN